MATYPGAIYSPTTVVDNVDDVLAIHINTPNGEIVAVQTELGVNVAGSLTDLVTRLAVSLAGDGNITLNSSSALTISAGAITATANLHTVTVETGTADNLDTITAMDDGYLLILSATDSAKPITIRHNVDNILVVGGRSVTMQADGDMVICVYSDALSKWRCAYTGKSAANVATKTTTYTATSTDDVLLGDASGGAFSITLPAATASAGMRLAVKKVDASANAVTIDGNASETIDGVTTKALSSQNAAYDIVCDGSAWYIV